MWLQSRRTSSEWAGATALALCLLSPLRANSDPLQEGSIVSVNAPAVLTQEGARSWVSPPIVFPDSRFIRLHFTAIRLEGSGSGTVRVLGRDLEVLSQWSFREFASGPERWTQVLPNGYAVVQVVRDDDNPVRLQFTIKEAARESRGGTVLSRQDPQHIRDKDLSEFASDAAIMSVARSVAKLSFPDGTNLATCTGFMVTPNLLLTNHHCVSTAESCLGTVAIFGYQRDAVGRLQPTKQYDCLAVVATSKARDYSLLRLDGEPGTAGEWGVLQFNTSAVLAAAQPLYLVQHSAGEPKRVAREQCNVSTPKAAGAAASLLSDFGHKCDTESGSSGSPILDLSHRVVGLHHFGFDAKRKRWARENRAVHIGPIASEIDRFLH